MDLNVIIAVILFAAAAGCLVQAYRCLADRAVDHMRLRWVGAAQNFLGEHDATDPSILASTPRPGPAGAVLRLDDGTFDELADTASAKLSERDEP